MIQMESKVEVADNTGARVAKMIGVIGKGGNKSADVGDIITAHVREATPTAAIKKGSVVKAVVVRKPGEHATEAEIIAAAGEHLASYQKPKSVDFVDSLPKAPTGKILKRDLRDPYWQDEAKKV